MVSLERALERKLLACWPAAPDQAEARRVLSTYGEARHEVEATRVRLAVLKLSGGSLEELHAMIRAAKADYRDVLAWAEYPEQAKAAWSAGPNLSQHERRQLTDMKARDRAQYEAWLVR